MHRTKEALIGLLAVISVFTILLEYLFPLAGNEILFTYVFDLVIVVIFAVDLFVRIKASRQRGLYLLKHWYEILALIPALAFAYIESEPIIGAALRSLRFIRVTRVLAAGTRLLRAFGTTSNIIKEIKLAYLLIISIFTIVFGAVSIFLIEANQEAAKITNLSDAFWWALATVTTVGYGDVVPITAEGRIVGSIIMIIGIAILGIFISTLGATLMDRRLREESKGLLGNTKDIIKKEINNLEKLTPQELNLLITMIKSLYGSQQRDKED